MRQSFRFAVLAFSATLCACSTPLSESFAPFDTAALANAKQHKNCAFDTVDAVVAGATTTIKRDKPVTVSGWMTDDALHAPAEFVFVLTGSQSFARKVPTGISRPDVAQVTGSAAAGTSGYVLQLDFGPVPPGTYLASAVQLTNTGALACQFNKAIVVVD